MTDRTIEVEFVASDGSQGWQNDVEACCRVCRYAMNGNLGTKGHPDNPDLAEFVREHRRECGVERIVKIRPYDGAHRDYEEMLWESRRFRQGRYFLWHAEDADLTTCRWVCSLSNPCQSDDKTRRGTFRDLQRAILRHREDCGVEVAIQIRRGGREDV